MLVGGASVGVEVGAVLVGGAGVDPGTGGGSGVAVGVRPNVGSSGGADVASGVGLFTGLMTVVGRGIGVGMGLTLVVWSGSGVDALARSDVGVAGEDRGPVGTGVLVGSVGPHAASTREIAATTTRNCICLVIFLLLPLIREV